MRENSMRNRILSMVMTFIFLAAMGSSALAATIYQNRPTGVDPAASASYYIWQDGDRWHVQTINSGSRHLFAGTVETDGAFSDVSAMASENSERIAMKVRNQKIEFSFNSLARTDGFSFTVSGSQNATFTLFIDDRPVDPANIYLGRQNRHPNSYSFPINNSTNYSYNNDPVNLLRFQGQPTALTTGNILGYFIWQEGDRWFLKTTTQGAQRQFTGTIRTGGSFVNVTRNSLEDNDIVKLNEASNEIGFTLRTENDQDGISFQLSNTMDATFMLFLDGQAINPLNIYLGSQNLHPSVNPFSMNTRDDQYNQYNMNDTQVLPSTSYDQTFPEPTTYQTIVSSYAQGQPDELNPGEVFGYFIWQDDQNRWTLQTTTKGAQRNFTGTLETGGTFSDVRILQSMRPSGTWVDTTVSNRINFSFKPGDSDQADNMGGLSFLVTDGSDIRFKLSVDGRPIDPSKIYLGKAGYHPTNSAVKIYSSN